MADSDIALIAHLMRRAGFGATYEELKQRAAKGYEATVEELIFPEKQPDIDLDLMHRCNIAWMDLNSIEPTHDYWIYRMVNSPRPLEEKISLFWHGILCVGYSKCDNALQIIVLVDKFRRHGLGDFPTCWSN